MIQIEAGAVSAVNKKPMVLFDNVLARGTLAASTEAAGYEAENAVDGTTWDFWKPTSATGHIWTTLSGAEACDCAFIGAHDLGTQGATVLIERSNTGIGYTTLSTLTPTTDEPILAIFPAATYQYWRIRITSASAAPVIGVAMIGKRLILPGIADDHTPTNLAHRVELLGGGSMGGQFLGNRVVRVGAETTVSFAAAERDVIDTDLAAFNAHYDDGKPFVWAGSPSQFSNDMAYSWRPENGGELRPVYTNAGLTAEFSMDLACYVET